MAAGPTVPPRAPELSPGWHEQDEGTWICLYRHDIEGEVWLDDLERPRWVWKLILRASNGQSTLAECAGPTRSKRLLDAMAQCDHLYEQLEARFTR
jgi:hypothetical protein